jgi:hypothetical protein
MFGVSPWRLFTKDRGLYHVSGLHAGKGKGRVQLANNADLIAPTQVPDLRY